MENRAHALIAGIFVILFSVAAMLTVWWFSGTREAVRDYLVVTQHNVTGLSPQAQVRYRGIWVGKVQQIKLDPDNRKNILILIRIHEDVPVTSETRAMLSYQGVTGIASILLEDGGGQTDARAPDDGSLYRIPMQPSLIEELSASAGAILGEASLTLHNINALLTPETRASFASLLGHLDTVMANLGPASRNFIDISQNLADASASLKKMLSNENSENLKNAFANLSVASARVQPLIEDVRVMVTKLDQASQHLHEFVVGLNQGKLVTIGSNLYSMTQNVSDAAKQLRRIFENFELSPQSLLFGEPRQKPGPGEKGFNAPQAMPQPEGTRDEGLN